MCRIAFTVCDLFSPPLNTEGQWDSKHCGCMPLKLFSSRPTYLVIKGKTPNLELRCLEIQNLHAQDIYFNCSESTGILSYIYYCLFKLWYCDCLVCCISCVSYIINRPLVITYLLNEWINHFIFFSRQYFNMP